MLHPHLSCIPPTLNTLPAEIQGMIYEKVFANSKIVLPGPYAPRRSERHKSQLPSLLRVCRRIYLQASPILYSQAVLEVRSDVAAKTIDQALQNKNIQLIKTVLVDFRHLKQTVGMQPKIRLPFLETVIVNTLRPRIDMFYRHHLRGKVHDICLAQARNVQAYRDIDWSPQRGFCVHITFKVSTIEMANRADLRWNVTVRFYLYVCQIH